MRLTFLGTGTSQGVPVIGCKCNVCQSKDFKDKRLRTSAHLQVGDLSILFDAGPDFRYQMLRAGITDLDAILVTHGHKDHIGGLDDVRALNWVNNKPVEVYCDSYATPMIINDFGYAFAKHKYPGVPQINLHEVDHHTRFKVVNLDIQPLAVMHYKLPILGYRIADFVYLTDTNYIGEQTMQLLKGAKVVVINALRKEKHISHFTLEESLQVIERIKPQVAYLTHISHQMGLSKIIESELPKNVFLAYDGLKIDF